MASLLEIINNPARYPDGTAWALDDGTQITLGELRTSMAPREALTEQERQYNDRLGALQREKAYLEQIVTQRVGQTPPEPSQVGNGQPAYDYNSDPLFKPLWERVQKVDTMEEQLKAMQNLQQQITQTLTYQLPAVLKMQQLQSQDPQFDANKFVEFARQNNFHPNQYDQAYKLMTYDQRLATEREAGVQAGMERAKVEFQANPQVPYAPYGPTQMQHQAPAKIYETTQEWDMAIMNDPDVIAAYRGEA